MYHVTACKLTFRWVKIYIDDLFLEEPGARFSMNNLIVSSVMLVLYEPVAVSSAVPPESLKVFAKYNTASI